MTIFILSSIKYAFCTHVVLKRMTSASAGVKTDSRNFLSNVFTTKQKIFCSMQLLWIVHRNFYYQLCIFYCLNNAPVKSKSIPNVVGGGYLVTFRGDLLFFTLISTVLIVTRSSRPWILIGPYAHQYVMCD